ncbi:MAG: YcaQ family DNA glycosylase, partial [Acidobacteriaceae bacterium]|nr:YcaQ family DNA glycosylase [Acidobacteriaceae bacterium]
QGVWYSVPRSVLEVHFGRGVLAVAGRSPDFARIFDLAERVIAAEHHERQVPHAEGVRELLRMAAKAHGIGTAADIADYYRMPMREARPVIQDLVEAGELTPVRVEGWREVAYLHRDAARPKRIEAMTLLAPFDPLIWYRPRTERLFGFEYRFEIFVPQHKRRWGVYVLPLLMGDKLVARVDLKADRAAGRLVLVSAHLEANADRRGVERALVDELRTLAGWLDLVPSSSRIRFVEPNRSGKRTSK